MLQKKVGYNKQNSTNMKISERVRHIILNSILVVCTLYIIIVLVLNRGDVSNWARVLKALPAICFIIAVCYIKRDGQKRYVGSDSEKDEVM